MTLEIAHYRRNSGHTKHTLKARWGWRMQSSSQHSSYLICFLLVQRV